MSFYDVSVKLQDGRWSDWVPQENQPNNGTGLMKFRLRPIIDVKVTELQIEIEDKKNG